MTRIPATTTLLAFEAAARHRSYSRAAEELGLTHGAISQRIRELESQNGVRLFERVGRAMQATDAAHVLLAQVRPALDLLERAFVPQAGPRRRLRLSVLHAFAARWLLPRLDDFRRQQPDIDLHVDASTTLARCGDGFDLAIRYGPGGWPQVYATRLRGERLRVVCTAAYRDAHALAAPADLHRATLLRNPWQPWTPWLRAAGLPDAPTGSGPSYSDAGLVLQAATRGEGVALARDLLVRDALRDGELVAPFDLDVEDGYAYFLVQFERSTTQMDAFRAWLTAQLA